jgi:hypothetical protein
MRWAELTNNDTFIFHDEDVQNSAKFGNGLWDVVNHSGKNYAIKKPVSIPSGPVYYKKTDEYLERLKSINILKLQFRLCKTKEKLIEQHMGINIYFKIDDFDTYLFFGSKRKEIFKQDCAYLFQDALRNFEIKEKEQPKENKALLMMFKDGLFRKKETQNERPTKRLSAEF